MTKVLVAASLPILSILLIFAGLSVWFNYGVAMTVSGTLLWVDLFIEGHRK